MKFAEARRLCFGTMMYKVELSSGFTVSVVLDSVCRHEETRNIGELTRCDHTPRNVIGRTPSTCIASSTAAEISPSSLSRPRMQNSKPTVAFLDFCSRATQSKSQSVLHQGLLPHTMMKGRPCSAQLIIELVVSKEGALLKCHEGA